MASPATLIAAVEAAIQARLAGDAYEEYTEAGDRFKGATLKDLFAMRAELQAEVAAESGTMFALAEPIDQ